MTGRDRVAIVVRSVLLVLALVLAGKMYCSPESGRWELEGIVLCVVAREFVSYYYWRKGPRV